MRTGKKLLGGLVILLATMSPLWGAIDFTWAAPTQVVSGTSYTVKCTVYWLVLPATGGYCVTALKRGTDQVGGGSCAPGGSVAMTTTTTSTGGQTIQYSAQATPYNGAPEISYRNVTIVPTYALSVTHGTGAGTYVSGTAVAITANARTGYAFSKWVKNSGAGSFAKATAASTTFTTGAAATAIAATYNDVSAPTVPAGLSATNIARTSFTFKWSAATDNEGVTDYQVRLNGSTLGATGGAVSASITGLLGGQTYSMQVRARDAAGNWSGWSATKTVKTNQAPIPAITNGNVTQINLGQSVTLTGTLQDPDGDIASHRLDYLNGSTWTALPGVNTTPSNATNSTKTGTFTPASLGTWQFRTVGQDPFGAGPEATLSVTVKDGTPPSVPAGLAVSANTTGTSFTLSWTASTDNVGVTGYEAMRGTTSLGTAAGTSTSVTGLQQATTYAVKVRARDAAGNWSAWSAVLNVTTPDVTAPTVPAGLAVSANTTGTSFSLSWTASTDNVGVTGYEVMRGTTSLGTAAGTSTSITGLQQATTYAMKVRARDAAGNWSAWSGVLNVTTPDVAAPTVPAGLSASANTTGTSFMLSWTASTDNVGVTGYEVVQATTSLGTVTGTSKSLAGLAEGTTYPMKVRARDAAGNWSAWSAVLNVTTPDVTPPSVPAGLAAAAVTETGFTVSWGASIDNVPGAMLYEVFRGGVSAGTTAELSLPLSGLSPGTAYPVTVRARDVAGNWSAPSAALVVTTSDLGAPTTPTNLAVSANTTGTTLTLTWTASTDNVGVAAYQVRQDATPLSPETTVLSLAITGLTPGLTYAFSVRARDDAGNWSGWSGSVAATTPDTEPPAAPAGLAASTITPIGFTLTWHAAADNGLVTEYQVRRDTTALTPNPVGPSTTVTALWPDTSYSMTVRARDAAGNWSPWSSPLQVTTAADSDPDNETKLKVLTPSF